MLGDPAGTHGTDINATGGHRCAHGTVNEVRADSGQRYYDEYIRHVDMWGVTGKATAV